MELSEILRDVRDLEKQKRRFGDRKDGYLLRDLDSVHFIMPIIYPSRCDNEAYIAETVDLTNINAYLEQKNANDPVFKYTFFHILVAAVMKTITLRPKMNRFIANKNTYQRNEVSAAFIVKKQFSDNGGEGLAFLRAKDDSTLDSLHEDLYRQITSCRSGKDSSGTDDTMEILNKLPRFISKFLLWILTRLDVHGWIPQSIISTDPYYSSVLLSNVGSIKLKSGYHHLTNWGTCSLFCLIGEKSMRPVFDENGNVSMREMLDLGMTIDERLADGYYYAKSIRLLKHLLQNPELLERPLSEAVDY